MVSNGMRKIKFDMKKIGEKKIGEIISLISWIMKIKMYNVKILVTLSKIFGFMVAFYYNL